MNLAQRYKQQQELIDQRKKLRTVLEGLKKYPNSISLYNDGSKEWLTGVSTLPCAKALQGQLEMEAAFRIKRLDEEIEKLETF